MLINVKIPRCAPMSFLEGQTDMKKAFFVLLVLLFISQGFSSVLASDIEVDFAQEQGEIRHVASDGSVPVDADRLYLQKALERLVCAVIQAIGAGTIEISSETEQDCAIVHLAGVNPEVLILPFRGR